MEHAPGVRTTRARRGEGSRERTVHDQPLIVQHERARGTIHPLRVDGRRGRVVEAVSGRRDTVNCGRARTKPDRGRRGVRAGRTEGRLRACRRENARCGMCTYDESVRLRVTISSGPLGAAHAPHDGPRGRIESPGRANGGPSQFRTGPSDDATGPDRQSGLRSPAAGGARPRRVWRSTPTDEGVRRRERFWGTEDPCAAKLFRAETTETAPACLECGSSVSCVCFS